MEREDIVLFRRRSPLCPITCTSRRSATVVYKEASGFEQKGRAVFEQLALGPHAPSGFKEMLDFAP